MSGGLCGKKFKLTHVSQVDPLKLRNILKNYFLFLFIARHLFQKASFQILQKENPAVSAKDYSWKIPCVRESSLQFLLSYSFHSISLNQKNCLFALQ